MSKKNLALVVSAVGALGLLVSVFAEPLGLGRGDGFGIRQTSGTIAGAVILVVGLLMYSKSTKTA